MKLIELTQGKLAVVDDSDFEMLIKWKWHALKSNTSYYAGSITKIDQKSHPLKMHRHIMGLEIGDLRLVDHRDHNGLNNQKFNLRIADHSENASNRSCIKHSTSKFLGVTHKIDRRHQIIKNFWYAQIRKNGVTHFLGSFRFSDEGEIRAAEAYDSAALKHHGEFANLNFPKR